MRLILALSNQCNRSCAYCYSDSNRDGVMSRAIADKAVEFALGRSQEPLQIAFFGGEPLLHFDVLRHVVDYSLSHANTTARPTFQLATNGDRVTDEIAAFLHERAFDVTVSVHDDTLSGLPSSIKILHANGVRPRPVLVASPATAEALPDKTRTLFASGVRRIGISPDYYAEWDQASREQLAVAYQRLAEICRSRLLSGTSGGIGLFDIRLKSLRNHTPLRDAHCSLGRGKVAVAPNGDIFPCDRMAVESCGAVWVIGNVVTGVDDAKWDGISDERDKTPIQCAECLYSPICTHFCACVNVHLSGRVCAACDTVCWHESMLGDIVFSLKADLDARGVGHKRRPPRGFARAATGLAAAGALTLSCDRTKSSPAPPHNPSPLIAATQPSTQPAHETWVEFPRKSDEPIAFADAGDVKGTARLQVCSTLPQDRLAELLDRHRRAVCGALGKRLSQLQFVSLAEAEVMQDVCEKLLRELVEIVGEEGELRGVRVNALDRWGRTPEQNTLLYQLRNLSGYIDGDDD